MKLDAHHHFWHYTPEDFAWLDHGFDALKRDFGPSEFRPHLDAAGVDAVISVEARQSEIETAYLLYHASRHDWVRGVIGYVPLESPDVAASLERFCHNRCFRGVRKVMRGRPEGAFAAEEFNRGVGHLRHFGLSFDVSVDARQLPEAVAFVDRHPQQAFVLDHLGRPDIENGGYEPWAGDLRRLGERPNVYAKVSGLATQADWASWTAAQLRPYFDTAVDCFGPKRLMFGGDWPVCTVATPYTRWVATCEDWTAAWPDADRQRFWSHTAFEAYGLRA